MMIGWSFRAFPNLHVTDIFILCLLHFICIQLIDCDRCVNAISSENYLRKLSHKPLLTPTNKLLAAN